MPPLGGALFILALLTAYFSRYALRTARHVDASYDSLEHSAHALEASEERFRAVAEAASDWIWEIDGQQRITYLSGRFNTVTGFSDQQWLGQDIEQLLYCDTTPIALWLGKLDGGTERQQLALFLSRSFRAIAFLPCIGTPDL